MRLFLVLMVVFLQFHFLLLLASNSTLDIPQHSSITETEALAEDGRLHIAAISKKGGGGGGRGGGGGGRGGGGRGRGGSGGRGSGRGGMLPFYGAAGAAAGAGAAAAHGSRSHHRGSTCRTARLGLTLPSLLIGLGIYLIQF